MADNVETKPEKNSVKSSLEPRQRNGFMVPLPETLERPPKEEYKPETDPYQPEYERKDPYKSTAGHVTVEFFRQINAEASGTPSVNGVMVPRRPKNYVKSNQRKKK